MRSILVLAAATLLLACNAPAPLPEAGIVGQPCARIDAPSNTRVEIVIPRYEGDAIEEIEGRDPTYIEIAVANGNAPLILVMRDAQAWRFSGRTERVIGVFTTAEARRVEGLPSSVPIVSTHSRARSSREFGEGCIAGTARSGNRNTDLPRADAYIYRLLRRHISDYHDPISPTKIEVGRPSWLVVLDNWSAAHQSMDHTTDIESSNRSMLEGEALRAQRRNALPSGAICRSTESSCREIQRLIEEGAVRLATNRDRDAWLAAARHSPIGRLWRPQLEWGMCPCFTILRETTIPGGMHGSDRASFFIAEGAPPPRDRGSHNLYFDINNGLAWGSSYGPAPGAGLLAKPY
jgi:hypothetical protein